MLMETEENPYYALLCSQYFVPPLAVAHSMKVLCEYWLIPQWKWCTCTWTILLTGTNFFSWEKKKKTKKRNDIFFLHPYQFSGRLVQVVEMILRLHPAVCHFEFYNIHNREKYILFLRRCKNHGTDGNWRVKGWYGAVRSQCKLCINLLWTLDLVLVLRRLFYQL